MLIIEHYFFFCKYEKKKSVLVFKFIFNKCLHRENLWNVQYVFDVICYYRSFRGQCNRTVTKNGERKCQQNSNAEVRRVWRFKIYTFTHTRKREITQCDTQTCSRSNNAETNSFFALNPIKFCDWYRWKKILLKSGPFWQKFFNYQCCVRTLNMGIV